ncbi:MAG: hypothetical protein R6V84_01105 [Desulfobacterales bacterium]
MLAVLRPNTGRLIAIGLLLLLLAGCVVVEKTPETPRAAAERAAPGKGAAAGKKVALIGVDPGLSGVEPGFPAYYGRNFKALLEKECPGLMFDAALAADLKVPPRLVSGLLDGQALAVFGRRQGVEFFLIGTLMDVKLDQKRTGFWLWKDTRYAIQAVVRVEVVDSATGAKIMDDSQRDEVVIDGLKHEELQQSQVVRMADYQPAMERMLRKSARLTCQALRDRPWQAFIVAAEGGAIVLSAGSDSGLAAGQVLEVFGLGAAMVGKDGQRFVPVGEKLGEATVSAVTRDSAKAVFAGWESVRSGGTVRMKR